MKTFVINLDRSPDRWRQISSTLTQEFFDFERVAAIDGNKSGDISLHASWLSRVLIYGGLSKSEIACYLSHKQIWQKIIDENIPLALILEDDAVPLKGCRQAIDDMDPSSIGLDMIRLHIYNANKVLNKKRLRTSGASLNNYDIYFQVGLISSATAYIITRQGAKKLLTADKIVAPVDWWSFHALFNRLCHGICWPTLFSNDQSQPSTIQDNYSAKKRKKMKPSHIIRKYINRIIIPMIDIAVLRRHRSAISSAKRQLD